VFAVSRAVRDLMMEVEGVPASQISVVHNGMRPLEEPGEEQLALTRSSLGLDERPVCLMIARLHEEKGHRVLFDALPAVLARYGPVRCLLAGEGVHRGALEAEVQRKGLVDHVRFLGRRRDIPALILLSRVVVLPSLAESFGYAVLEAMSLGRPVVASDAGGLPEVVRDGVTGLVVPKGDHSALATALITVLTDRELADRLGRAGREWARQFSYGAMIDGYERVYRQLWDAPA
jgi:glycosyltransferase involved in cell wall biosynthesis